MAIVELITDTKEDTAELGAALHAENISYSQKMFFRDDANTAATMIGGLLIEGGVFPVAVGVLGGWLVARQNRKIRIKIGDTEIEAGSMKELQAAAALVGQMKEADDATHETSL